ncbi:Uncharacterised protein [Nocardia cyriacigeorgica]|uniref:Uncharacterized protein n=1 Tax=Nocardia cyriacigeorgica TaxID=135487 RepID=A0A4V6YTB3_9NOCA|nr:Uncharacterised protein [Nocardia cyriacigeorgica]
MATVDRGRRSHFRGPGRSLGRRGLPRPGRRARHRQQPPRRIPRRRRRFRPRILRHHTARSRRHGSATAATAAHRLASAGRRHPRSASPSRYPHRRVRRRDGQRMGERADERLRRDHRAARLRQRVLHDRQPAVLPAGSAGPEHGRRYRVLVVAERHPPRLHRPGDRGMRSGAGRWSEPRADAGGGHLLHPGRTVGARRAMQTVQRCGRRHRARRRRGGTGAATAGRRASRRAADLRGDHRQRRQFRRPQQRHHRAEPVGAAAGRRAGLRARRCAGTAGGFHRSARHRHRARRHDRGQGTSARCTPDARGPAESAPSKAISGTPRALPASPV